MAVACGLGFPRIKLDDNRYQIYSMLDAQERERVAEKIRAIVDVGGWQHLMNESGLRTFMDAQTREKWDRGLHENGTVPELTDETIRATFRTLHDSRARMFEDGVISVFRSLSWDYKTNRPFAFGKRIIRRGLLPHSYYGHHNAANELDDLTRVMAVMDSQPEPDHRQGWWRLLSDARNAGAANAANNYLSVKWFKNGNGHITFLRPDLVEYMNRILARRYPGALAFDRGTT